MNPIRVALVGVGNCASSLVQGLEYYRTVGSQTTAPAPAGLMHPILGGYPPSAIQVVAAFDVDERKVGRPLAEAIFAEPNCAARFVDRLSDAGPIVQRGPQLDGVSESMAGGAGRTFQVGSGSPDVNIAETLKQAKVELLVNYLPVGSDAATHHYATAALEAGVGFINCIPVFIASDPAWAARFAEKRLPLIGDDIKSQVGATIVHRQLARLFADRGVHLKRTYQLNTGGNTDFKNILDQSRIGSKRTSKTEAVTSVAGPELEPENVHIGPSDFVPWLEDNKVAFIRLEGAGFGGLPLEVELRLSVQDSPNNAGVVIDAIRCGRLALDRKQAGTLDAVSAYTMKHPPRQIPDDEACRAMETFIAGD